MGWCWWWAQFLVNWKGCFLFWALTVVVAYMPARLCWSHLQLRSTEWTLGQQLHTQPWCPQSFDSFSCAHTQPARAALQYHGTSFSLTCGGTYRHTHMHIHVHHTHTQACTHSHITLLAVALLGIPRHHSCLAKRNTRVRARALCLHSNWPTPTCPHRAAPLGPKKILQLLSPLLDWLLAIFLNLTTFKNICDDFYVHVFYFLWEEMNVVY